jgi:hypothetical protein
MKKAKKKSAVKTAKKSRIRDRRIEGEPMRADLKEVIDRHSQALDEWRRGAAPEDGTANDSG